MGEGDLGAGVETGVLEQMAGHAPVGYLAFVLLMTSTSSK